MNNHQSDQIYIDRSYNMLNEIEIVLLVKLELVSFCLKSILLLVILKI